VSLGEGPQERGIGRGFALAGHQPQLHAAPTHLEGRLEREEAGASASTEVASSAARHGRPAQAEAPGPDLPEATTGAGGRREWLLSQARYQGRAADRVPPHPGHRLRQERVPLGCSLQVLGQHGRDRLLQLAAGSRQPERSAPPVMSRWEV
jgi:hypothetical protein